MQKDRCDIMEIYVYSVSQKNLQTFEILCLYTEQLGYKEPTGYNDPCLTLKKNQTSSQLPAIFVQVIEG